jgi:hypothetical protein
VRPAAGGRRGGLDFALPAGGKANEREGLVLLGSDTEPGVIIVRFMPSTTRDLLQAGYQQGLHESGVSLMPAKPIELFANNGLAGELSGRGQDGSQLTARVIGVPTPFGDSAVFLGLTTKRIVHEAQAPARQRHSGPGNTATSTSRPAAARIPGRIT